MTEPSDLSDLKRIAEEATPGPWRASETWRPPIGNRPTAEGERVDRLGNVFWGYSLHGCDERGVEVLPTFGAVHNFPDRIDANARYIATFDPPTVLSLIARIEAAEAELAGFKADTRVVEQDFIARIVAAEARVKALEEGLIGVTPAFRKAGECWCCESRDIERVGHEPSCVRAAALLTKEEGGEK